MPSMENKWDILFPTKCKRTYLDELRWELASKQKKAPCGSGRYS